MAQLTGNTSEEVEAAARALKRSELVEIANRDNFSKAMKARAELDRRDQVKVHWILGFSGAAALAAIGGVVIAVIK